MDENKNVTGQNLPTTESLGKPKFAWHRSAGEQVIESVDFYIDNQKIEPEPHHK
jgi:hypothetical protein